MYGQRVVLMNSINVISFFSVAGLVDSETNFASSSGFSSLFVTMFPFLSPLKLKKFQKSIEEIKFLPVRNVENVFFIELIGWHYFGI